MSLDFVSHMSASFSLYKFILKTVHKNKTHSIQVIGSVTLKSSELTNRFQVHYMTKEVKSFEQTDLPGTEIK